MRSKVWAKAFEQSRRMGAAAPAAPPLIVIDHAAARCVACGQHVQPDPGGIREHHYQCDVDCAYAVDAV